VANVGRNANATLLWTQSDPVAKHPRLLELMKTTEIGQLSGMSKASAQAPMFVPNLEESPAAKPQNCATTKLAPREMALIASSPASLAERNENM
jgi:hypothetical protein